MKRLALISRLLTASFAYLVSTQAFADPAVPFTENFVTTANWSTSSGSLVAPSLVATGGPDGSSYVSRSSSAAGFPDGTPFVQFRAQDEFGSSGGAFEKDWIAGNLNQLTAYVRHNAPESLRFFARFTLPTGGAGIVFETPAPLSASNDWTQLTFAISASSPYFTPEGSPALFNSILTNVGHLQIGYSVPTGFGGNSNTFTYDLDVVSSSIVPEPASWLLAIGGSATIVGSRKRRVC